jgi:hypothetical protein
MADASSSATDRIQVAIARIEAVMAARTRANHALVERHEVLRRRMAEAIAALDAVLAGNDERVTEGED